MTESQSTCNCGIMAKTREKHVSHSCDPKAATPVCSCVRKGKICSRSCRCVNCTNSQIQPKSVADEKRKGCTCGSSKKETSVVSCQDSASRKSKCPCLKNNIYCSHRCKCTFCGNKCEDAQGLNSPTPHSNGSGTKRKRNTPETYKRCKGVEFLAKEGFEITVGPWTEMETLTLSVAEELIKDTGLPVSPSNVTELYNYVACSGTVKELALPIAYKSTRKILNKLSHLHSKQSIFTSLLDSASDKSNTTMLKT